MTSRASLIALGIGAYLAFAIATFPASVAYRWFAPQEITLAAVEGTVWRGSAAYGGINGLAFADLDWQLHPAALLTGGLSLTAEARIAGGLARTDLVLRGSRVALSNFRASVNLQSLDALLPLSGVVGTASLTLERLELVDGWPVAATGTARVAGLAGPPIFPVAGVTTLALGNFFARIESGNDGSILAVVNDEGGPLELTDGRALLNADRSYRLEAAIRPRPDAHAALVDGLRFFPANAAGQHVIVDQGQL
jgi:general secretion pathway protein N